MPPPAVLTMILARVTEANPPIPMPPQLFRTKLPASMALVQGVWLPPPVVIGVPLTR